ncbi:hypothetical protein [Salinibacter ruber]|uniref:hypothetical protein n=1 Tax=Salinibacter ruber TaxID=146919 RepID=UPI002073E8C3|nr:hypothetical protein [Salinibacter ruber]
MTPKLCFEFDEDYPYTSLYEGEYEYVNHYYGPDRIGQMNQKEAECAFFLDHQPGIEHWVRNLAQNRNHAFWLQTASGKFYPDFVCKYTDGRTLVVEYKGEHLMDAPDAKEKDNVGVVWAECSEDQCEFIMVGMDDYREKVEESLS